MDLRGHHVVLDGRLGELFAVQDVGFVIVGRLQVLVLHLPEVVDNQVVCNAAYPCGKMAVLDVTSLLDGSDGFDKGVLEQVIGQVLVFHRVIYIHEYSVLVTLQELIKGLVLAIDI